VLLSLHSEESRERFQEALNEIRERKQAETNIAVTHIRRGSLAEIFYLANLTPVLDAAGNVKFIQVIMRDVTELQRIEKMKESLIRDVAHELKTPAAKFQMTTDWFEKELEKRNEKDKYHEVTQILKNNADRLMRTITSIMDLTKLQAGVDHTVKAEMDLTDVLRQANADIGPLAKQKNLEFECHLLQEPLMMLGDSDMLYRLFINLLGNAIKFTETGKITLASYRDGGQIRADVHDTGIGIDKSELDNIFERFVQKTPSSVGIGLGLAISRDIVVLHQGRIWAESEGEGKGSTFKVEFPAI